ncbi:MAG: hypothetical protein ACE5HI_11890, partial [bacterium]
LDGRKYARASNGLGEPSNEMTLRFAMMDQRGRLFDERALDERVCDCCPTSAVRTPHGALVVYRDRTETEIRDTAIVRFRNGKWSEPQTLYADNWEVKGCPVNGPAIAAQEEKVAVAWFTMANETPRVQVAFSNNEGVDFGDPIQVDDGNPLGRVDAVLLPDGAALVSWLETTDGGAEIRLRRIQPNGSSDVSMTLTQSSTERASGFPRMVRQGNEIYFAWTQPGNPAQVRTAVATLNSGTDANSD